MNEELIEKAAREICRTKGIDPDRCMVGEGGIVTNPDGTTMSFTNCFLRAWESEISIVRAALSVAYPAIVEECAKVVESARLPLAPDDPYRDKDINHATQIDEEVALLHRIAAAIREMAKEKTK